MDEIRKNFHNDLESVRAEVIRLGASLTESIPRATAVLLSGDLEGADYLVQADDEFDGRSAELEVLCFEILALQSPVAADLRQIVAIIKIAGELERSADLVVNICKAARRIYGHDIDPMLRIFLNVLLKGPTGISTAGLPLELGEELFHLLAKVSHFVADGDGHRQALEWNGASAIRPCFRHWNLLKLGTDLANRDPANEFVEFDCAAPERFRLSTTADLHSIADTLVAMKARVVDVRATMTRMKQFQKACGFTCSPSGLLTDRQLGIDIVNAFCYDWMQTFLQDGVLTTEAALLVAACVAKLGMTLNDLKNYFREEWCFPRQHKSKGTRLWLIFQDRRVSEHKLKAAASEMLQLYGLLRHFFQRHVWTCAEVRDELDAFEAACRSVDIFLQAKRGIIDMHEAATLLEDSARQHLLLHIRAHGKAFLKPKHHSLDV